MLAVNGCTRADADADALLSALDDFSSGCTVLLGATDGDPATTVPALD